jgi:hypothetical protein
VLHGTRCANANDANDRSAAWQSERHESGALQSGPISFQYGGGRLSIFAGQAQQSAINNQSLGALSSAFGALAQSAANRLARTRNSAGYGDLLDELSREQGRQTASVAQQNQFGFANKAQQDQLTALQGLSGLYGVNTSLLGRTLGIPGQLLNTRTNLANAPGFGSAFAQSLGRSLGGLL